MAAVLARLSESVEDYLKAIYVLADPDGAVGTASVASRLEVTQASVSGMLRKLSDREPPLVEYRGQGTVSLTAEGRRVALRTLRRHRLVELFLTRTLGYTWDEVHDEAERLEHAISPLFEDRLARFLDQPRYDPHGDPIPDRDLEVPDLATDTLPSLSPGQNAEVVRVRTSDPEALRYLRRLGLVPGAPVRLQEAHPADRTLLVQVGDPPVMVVIGQGLADNLLVSRGDVRGA